MPTAPEDAANEPGLLRVLGLGMAMAMVIGNVIGAGIFMMPGKAAAQAGSFPIVFSAWVIGGVYSILGGLCFAELAVMLPRAGGMYVYLKESYGKLIAFLFSWSEFVFGRPASIGVMAVGIVYQWTIITGRQPADVSMAENIVVSLVVIISLTVINILGVIWGGRMQSGTTIIKAGFLSLLALLPLTLWLLDRTGWFASLTGNVIVDRDFYSTTVEPEKSTLPTQFAGALLAILWAYNGWHAVTPIAEEVKEPRRNIPLALFGGLGILITIYLAVNLAYHSVLSLEEIQVAGIALPQAMVGKLLTPISVRAAEVGIFIISVVAVCSITGSMNANLMNGPRIMFAAARDGLYPSWLSKVHPRYHTPARAIVLQSVMAAVLIIASGVLITYFEAFRKRTIFDMLADYVVFIASIFFMLTVGSVIILRVKHPEWERPYKTWGYPIVPVAFLVISVWFLWHVYLGQTTESLIGLGLTGLGLPVYWYFTRHNQEKPSRNSGR